MLLLARLKSPDWIGRVLPNRWEGLTENSWMYGQLQTLTVLPVGKLQTNRGRIAWQSRKMMPHQTNLTPKLLRLN